jgi:hypothetical protein
MLLNQHYCSIFTSLDTLNYCLRFCPFFQGYRSERPSNLQGKVIFKERSLFNLPESFFSVPVSCQFQPAYTIWNQVINSLMLNPDEKEKKKATVFYIMVTI